MRKEKIAQQKFGHQQRSPEKPTATVLVLNDGEEAAGDRASKC